MSKVGKVLPRHTQARGRESRLRGCDEAVEGPEQVGRLGRWWTRRKDVAEPTWGTGTASQTEGGPGVRTQRWDERWPLKGMVQVLGRGQTQDHPDRGAAGRAVGAVGEQRAGDSSTNVSVLASAAQQMGWGCCGMPGPRTV